LISSTLLPALDLAIRRRYRGKALKTNPPYPPYDEQLNEHPAIQNGLAADGGTSYSVRVLATTVLRAQILSRTPSRVGSTIIVPPIKQRSNEGETVRSILLMECANHRKPREQLCAMGRSFQAIGQILTCVMRDLMRPITPEETTGYVIHLPGEGDVSWRSVLAVITGKLFPGKRAHRSGHTP
jgi:hypothetical protein